MMAESSSKKLTDLAFQALVVEYTSIREASLSRDQIKGSLENFMMLVLTGAVIALPTIISQQQFLLFPIFSIIFSNIALAHLGKTWRVSDLAAYEEQLRLRLINLISAEQSPNILHIDLDWLWQWQLFLRNTRGGKLHSRLYAIFSSGMETLFVFVSVGFLLLFLYYRGIIGLSDIEIILIIIATTYCIFFLVSIIYTIKKSMRPQDRQVIIINR